MLAEPIISFVVPTFTDARVVGPLHPLAFVPDAGERYNANYRFFDPNASNDERLAIIKRYRPTHLLLSRQLQAGQPAMFDFLSSLGSVVYEDDRYVLLKL